MLIVVNNSSIVVMTFNLITGRGTIDIVPLSDNSKVVYHLSFQVIDNKSLLTPCLPSLFIKLL